MTQAETTAIAIHAGSGTISKSELSAEKDAKERQLRNRGATQGRCQPGDELLAHGGKLQRTEIVAGGGHGNANATLPP